jgi:nucleoside-diphosphate-sugar epimerase
MRVAVTGATGFIGCNLAKFLADAGHEVVATGRASNPAELARAKDLGERGVRIEEGSLLNAGFTDKVVAGCEVVIHLAAAQHEGNVPDSYFREVNVDATRRLIKSAIAAGVRRLVYGSTIGVYGSAATGELSETSPARPENIYAVTKLEAEQVILEHAAQLETCIARISETYGPGDFRLLKLFRAIDRGVFVMIGPGTNVRQVIYVDDLVKSLWVTAEHPASVGQIFVLSGSHVMDTNSMVSKIAAALRRRPPRIHVPIWPFRAAAIMFENTFCPLGLQPPLNQRRLDFFTKSFYFSTVKYRQLLGFTPQVTFDTGATVTAEWYRSGGYL